MKQLTDHPLPGTLPASFFSALVHRVEYALTVNADEPVRDLADVLGRDVEARMRACPSAVRDAVVGYADADAALRMAFELGRLAFAQQLASTVAGSRPDPGFYLAYQDPILAPTIEALLYADVASQDLMAQQDKTLTEIAEVLRQLRFLGIADFRSGGPGVTINFLTPTGRAYAQMQDDQKEAEENLHV